MNIKVKKKKETKDFLFLFFQIKATEFYYFCFLKSVCVLLFHPFKKVQADFLKKDFPKILESKKHEKKTIMKFFKN